MHTEVKIWFLFSKNRLPSPSNSEIYIVLIYLQIKQFSKIPTYLTSFYKSRPFSISLSLSLVFIHVLSLSFLLQH